MMPEVDGFAVLDALRGKPETANIPVIVATAKALTIDEKSRLQGQIQSLMLKGDFLNDEFLEEVRCSDSLIQGSELGTVPRLNETTGAVSARCSRLRKPQ